jgi:two-component system, chemotaxis family, response regulator Rcp1
MASQKYSYEIEAMASGMENGCASHLLLVEDSAHYVRQLQEALRDVNASINLHVADDGINAMAFLRREGINVNAPRPDLILLDLNLPRMDGREVLMRIKTDDNLKTIPTIILSSSELDDDVMASYRLHANAYLKKPLGWMRSCAG